MLGSTFTTSVTLRRGICRDQLAKRVGTSGEHFPLTRTSTRNRTIQPALQGQKGVGHMAGAGGGGRIEFLSRVHPYAIKSREYEDRSAQEAALRTINVSELEEKALIALAREGKLDVSQHELDFAKLAQLLEWFKASFSWVNQPQCDHCGGDSYRIGNGVPTPAERQWQVGRVELFRCRACGRDVRFPRIDDPVKLLETRRGRCGEWANCFTLYCRALGYRARLILDFTDHVWTECYFPQLGRWVHSDPCEAVLDQPLLYEVGWKKKLSYIIALSHDSVRDVTKRYTRQWPELLTRRTIISEEEEGEVVSMLNMEQRADVSEQQWDELAALDLEEDDEIAASYRAGVPAQEGPMAGRQSGSAAWRLARGEMGTPNSSSGVVDTERPVRLCVDEHVALIREAVGCLVSDVTDADHSVAKVVLCLKALHAFLEKMKSEPFRTRRAKLDGQTEGAWLNYASDETVGLILQALSLLPSPEDDGAIWAVVEGDGVPTALALPVALELLERLVKDVPSEGTVKWLVDGARLCKGVACASGENDPVGVASTAFDGLHSSKWEEPNGGKRGAWIVYHLSDREPRVLAAYEITSANDCPSRDPRDWVLEGSNDDGASWRSLDSRKGEVFEERFLSKTYEIAKGNHLACDSFRFRFLSSRNPAEDGRLQIGCIDLIAFKV